MFKTHQVIFIVPPLNSKSGWGRYSIEIIKEMEARECVNLKTLEEGRDFIPLKGIMSFFINILRIRKLAQEYEIIHTFDGWPYGVYGYFAVLGTRRKLFINAVGTYSVAPLSKIFKKYFLSRAYKAANSIFAISHYTSKRIKDKLNLQNLQVVHLGLNKLPLLHEEEVKKFAELNKLTGIYPIILTVGSIKHRKGQLDTLKAVCNLKAIYPSVIYIMAGHGNDPEYLKKINAYISENNLNENVRIFERLNDEELSCLYSITNVVALNSNNDGEHFEGLGMVLVEAASFGKPVIGSRDCGIEDAIVNNVTGFLSRQGDVVDIAKKITEILLVKAHQFGIAGLTRSQNMTWKRTADEYLKNYEKYAN